MVDRSPLSAPSAHPEAVQAAGYRDRLQGEPRGPAVRALCEELGVRFLRLMFTDLLGHTKNVEVPISQLDKVLEGDVLFDGSSVEGFARVEESDMVLVGDLTTFRVLPWGEKGARVARLICDICHPDGRVFVGDPRNVLRRQVERAHAMGFEMMAGVEAEFFLFATGEDGRPTTRTHDRAGYFDLAPTDRGERARRTIVTDLEAMGFAVEAAHHEVAHGQHEIGFQYAPALMTADRLTTFRFVVRNAARAYGLHATFMPKPLAGANGSGMHTHQSLVRDGSNAFADPEAEDGIGDLMRHYIGGLMEHAPAIAAVTNPLVNSYKRLVPGYEAPVEIAWSCANRSPLIRVPDRRGSGTRVEFRMPDPAANPYLALAVQLAAGLDGIERSIAPGPPATENVWSLTDAERKERGIRRLPAHLGAALDALEADAVIGAALGEHVREQYLRAKRKEWAAYAAAVTDWERERYLAAY